MDKYFCTELIFSQALLDPFSLYSATKRILSLANTEQTVVRAESAACGPRFANLEILSDSGSNGNQSEIFSDSNCITITETAITSDACSSSEKGNGTQKKPSGGNKRRLSDIADALAAKKKREESVHNVDKLVPDLPDPKSSIQDPTGSSTSSTYTNLLRVLQSTSTSSVAKARTERLLSEPTPQPRDASLWRPQLDIGASSSQSNLFSKSTNQELALPSAHRCHSWPEQSATHISRQEPGSAARSSIQATITEFQISAAPTRRIKIGRPPKNSLPCGGDNNGNFSRHNDMVYYPNIQCLLCKEWVCSRNRYMHIESHLQYKPYKCSICGYDNRKEIFISLHIRRIHSGKGEVYYQPDPELEKRAWALAEECLQHTRQLLLSQHKTVGANEEPRDVKNSSPKETTISIENNSGEMVPIQTVTSPEQHIAGFNGVYRPRITNTQRIEKTHIIEENRQMGMMPELKNIVEREIQCSICGAYVLRSQAVAEEHVRSHLVSPSYLCIVPGCATTHASRLFMLRHMKEVHKLRKPPEDLLASNIELLGQFLNRCREAFVSFFTPDTLERIELKYSAEAANIDHANTMRLRSLLNFRHPNSLPPSGSTSHPLISSTLMMALNHNNARIPNQYNEYCIGCKIGLTFDLGMERRPCINCATSYPSQSDDTSGHVAPVILSVRCFQCAMQINADLLTILRHTICHLRPLPFGCSHCVFSHWSCAEVERHNRSSHSTVSSNVIMNYGREDLMRRWLDMVKACFGHPFIDRYINCD